MKKADKELQAVLDAAQMSHPVIAANAIRKLGESKAKEAAPIITARIKDRSSRVRLACVKQAAAILGKAAVPYLAERLYLDRVIDIGMEAARQLATIGTTEAAEALIAAGSTENHMAGTHADFGLAYWDSFAGIEPLLEALENPGVNHGEIALALGRTGEKKLVGALASAYARAGSEVERLQVAAGLTLLGDDRREEFYCALESNWPRVRLVALDCISETGDRAAFLNIVPLLKDKDPEVASKAHCLLEVFGLTQDEGLMTAANERAKMDIKAALPPGFTVEAGEEGDL